MSTAFLTPASNSHADTQTVVNHNSLNLATLVNHVIKYTLILEYDWNSDNSFYNVVNTCLISAFIDLYVCGQQVY